MNNIVDPLTNELHSIFSNHGKLLLKNYVTLLQNGGSKKAGGNPKGRGTGKSQSRHAKSKYSNVGNKTLAGRKSQKVNTQMGKQEKKIMSQKLKMQNDLRNRALEELKKEIRGSEDFFKLMKL